jgi:quercetin dioxygenase-like cupin family protein
MKNLFDLKHIAEREVVKGYNGKFIHSDHMTMAYWRIEAGHDLPEHHHEHEQVVNVLSGQFELTLDGQPILLERGKVLVIPSNVPHAGRSITDCEILDVFQPVREDYVG